MRISNWLRSIISRWLRTDLALSELTAVVSRREAAIGEIIAAMSRSEVALTERIDALTELHKDLVRQVGLHRSDTLKQCTDLRAIVAQLGEQAKQKPAVAGNMADIRRFMGDAD